jgi:ribosomal protein S2
MLDYTLDQFINTNIYLGYSKKFTTTSSFSYLINVRTKICIINLYWSIYCIKKIYNYLSGVLKNFGGIWLINFKKNFFLNKRFLRFFYSDNKFRLSYWTQSWSSGILTNFKYSLRNLKLNWRYIWYPSTVFFFTTHQHPQCVLESNLANIMSIYIADTSVGIYNNTYCLPGNEKSFSSFYLYNQLIQNFLVKIFLIKKFYFKKTIMKDYYNSICLN